MAIENDFLELENDPEFKALKASDPARAAKLARFAARKLAQASGVRGTDPRVRDFLNRNLQPVQGYRGNALQAAANIIRSDAARSYADTAIGAGERFVRGTPRPQGNEADLTFGETLATMRENAARAARRNPLIGVSPALLGVASLMGPETTPAGAYLGLAAGTASMAAKAPDIIVGGIPGAIARGRALARPVVAGVEAAAGGLMSGGQTFFEGGTPEEVLRATGLGAALGAGTGYMTAKPAVTTSVLPRTGTAPNVNLLSREGQRGTAQTVTGRARLDRVRAEEEMRRARGYRGRQWEPQVIQSTARSPQEMEAAARIRNIVTEIPEAARPISPSPARQLPPPGATSIPRDFDVRPLPNIPSAETGQFLPADAANAAFMAAREARVAAQNELDVLVSSGANRKRIQRAEQNLRLRIENERSVTEAATRALEQQRLSQEAARRAAEAEAWAQANAPRGPIYGAPPRVPPGLPAPGAIPGALTPPPGSTSIWDFPPAVRGFSEEALYGRRAEPIVPPAPSVRPALPAPTGPEMILPTPIPPAAFSEQALGGQITPRGIPMPPPPTPRQLPPPGGPEVPFPAPPVSQFSPGSLYEQFIPPAQRAAMSQAEQDLAAQMGRLTQPALPAPPVRGMEQALYGQFPAPPVSPATVARIQQERIAAENAYNALIADTGKMTKEKQAAIAAALDNVIEARNAEINAIQRLRESMQVRPTVEPPPPPAAPPAPKGGRKKKIAPTPEQQGFSQTPLGRLLSEEGGQATPEGALGAVVNAAGAVIGAGGRAAMTGARIFRDALAQHGETLAGGIQRVGDAQSFILDDIVGRYGGQAVRSIGNATVTAIDNMLSGNRGGVPGTLRRRIDAAINSVPGSTWAEKTMNFKNIVLRNPANTGIKALDEMFDWPRRLFVGEFGAPPEALAIKQAAREAAISVARPFEDLMERILQRPDVDNVQLYRDIENPNYAGADPDVLEAKRLIGNLEKELLDLGAITQEQFNKFNSSYLPREYAKYFWMDPDTSETVKAIYRVTNDKLLKGWYERGLSQEMTQKELAAALARGEQWTVRGPSGRGNNVYAWRDWTKAERAKWGEIEHANRALLRYTLEAQQAFQKGKFLDGLAKGRDADGVFSLPESAVYTPGPGVVRPDRYVDPATNQEYIYLEGTVDRGINKLGNLAGQYVRDDIAAYALANEGIFSGFGERIINPLIGGSQWLKKNTLVDFWKRLKTTFNAPMYLFNNFFAAPTALVQWGGTMADLPKAMVMASQGEANPIVARAMERGIIRDGARLREISNRISPILNSLTNNTAGIPTPVSWSRAFDAAAEVVRDPKRYRTVLQPALAAIYRPIAEATRGVIRRVDQLASGTDDLFILALAEGLRRRRGIEIDQALDIAQQAFYNAKNYNSLAVKGTEGIIPFVRVAAYNMDSYPTGMATNPHRTLYLALLGTSMPYAAAALGGVSGNTVGERVQKFRAETELLPARMRTGGFEYGLPKAIPAGTDELGNTRYLDLSNVAMTGQLGVVEGLSGVPKMLSPGGFAFDAAQLVFNKDVFTGKPIFERSKIEGMPPTYDYTYDFINRKLMPPAAYNISEMAKSSQMFPDFVPFLGGRFSRGLEYTLPTQIMRAGGLKMVPIDAQKQARIALNQFNLQEKDEREQYNILRKRLVKATEKQAWRDMESLLAEMEDRKARINEIRRLRSEAAQRIAPAFINPETPTVGEVVSDPADVTGLAR